MMKLPKNITPTGLISSVLIVGALASAILTVESRYFHSDAAAALSSKIEQDQKNITNNLAQIQQQDRVETDLGLVKLEQAFLESQLETKAVRPEADISVSETKKRLEYLDGKRKKLEEYQLRLEPIEH